MLTAARPPPSTSSSRTRTTESLVHVLTQSRRVGTLSLTVLLEGGADHPHFLESVLPQCGHLDACCLAFGALPGFRREQMQLDAFPAGAGAPRLERRRGERRRYVMGASGPGKPPLHEVLCGYCPLITPTFGCPRLGLLLDAIAPCLCHRCQCLRDLVGGHTLGAEIQHHPFGIVPPKDPINEIIRTSLQDMDRAHGAVLPSSQVSIFSHFLVGI